MEILSKRSTLTTSLLTLATCALLAGCGVGDSHPPQPNDVAQLTRASVCSADAQAFEQQSGSNGWTQVSGYAHSYLEYVAPRLKGIFYLSLMEKTDDPVELFVAADLLAANYPSYDGWNDDDNGNLKLTDGNSSSLKEVDVGEGAYIRAIQVCTTDKENPNDNKIKGLRIWGATLNLDGSLDPYSWSESFERPNCAKWQTKVGCPSGKVATGLRAHYLYSSIGFSGLALRCSTPEPVEFPWCD